MENSESFGLAFAFVFVIWLLGIFWHPFGTPTNAWHWVFGISNVFFGMGFFYFSQKESEPEEDQEEYPEG